MHELALFKTLEYFIENPYTELYLRELARKLKMSPYAIKGYVDILIKEGLLKEERKANLRIFRANLDSIFFKQLKISFSIMKILKSGLIEFIKDNISGVSSIVLFGSVAKGMDDKKSDIDILVIGKYKDLSLSEAEKKLGKDISLHIINWNKWNKNAKDNKAFYFEVIAYGIPLYGELPIVKWK